ncbi:MAG: hypothetical protein IE909_08055 [Campylobacterales bacterium]|nr:hypothetical protein [Campylobacterales bacterium]
MSSNLKSAISLKQLKQSKLKDFIKDSEICIEPLTYKYCVNNPYYRKSLDIIKEYYLLNSSLTETLSK